MGITVGAALKRAAISILGNPKALKKLLFAVLVVFVALLLPMVMVVCLFSGSFQVDSGELLRYVEANLTASDVELLQNVETTMTEIENAMIEAELSADVGAAQALYIMALYDFAGQPEFVSRLVSCFEAEQTDAQLIANVNAAFGTEIPVQEFTDVMRKLNNIRDPEIGKLHILQGIAVEGIIYILVVDASRHVAGVPRAVLLGVGHIHLVDGQGAFGGGIDAGIFRLSCGNADGEAE